MCSAIADNVKGVRERIEQAAWRCGRKPEEIKLVAVTKTVPADIIQEAVEAGIEIIGENYVQEAASKRERLAGSAQWHMIGHLQSKKARQAVQLFDVIETVDRKKTIEELQRHAHKAGKKIDVLIQVNLSGESSKSGTSSDLVLGLIEATAICENLSCRGLMTLPPYYNAPERSRPFFCSLRRLMEDIQPRCPIGVELRELSMGMSGDFEVAIEEGATLVRVGTALFGTRHY